MRSSAIHREREREREKEVKKCQNSRSFEHLPFLKEGIITFDQKTSFCCIVVSLWTISSFKRAENAAQEIGRYRRHNATPPEGICGVFDALFSHRASNEENTMNSKTIICRRVVREKRRRTMLSSMLKLSIARFIC